MLRNCPKGARVAAAGKGRGGPQKGEGKGRDSGKKGQKSPPNSSLEGYCQSCGKWGQRTSERWGPKIGSGVCCLAKLGHEQTKGHDKRVKSGTKGKTKGKSASDVGEGG